jgi:glycosyltransferase involved in cell wall biosynthesis
VTDHAPLVSCIMPTRDRRAFVGQAIDYFRRQTYPRAELVVVDDGHDAVADLVPADPCISYIRLDGQRSIGFKRNAAIERARGDVVVHWDDDDWYGSERLRHQLAPLLSGRAHVSGLKTGLMLDVLDGRFWSCRSDLHARMFYADLHGGTIAYLKTLWSTIARFPDSSLAEDAAFLRAVTGRATIAALPNEDTFIYVRHGSNAWEFVCGRAVDAGAWTEAAAPSCIEADRPFYRQLGAAMAADTTSVKRYGDTCRRAGSYHEALQYYVRAIELDRNNVWAWFDKGLTLEALGRHGHALDAVREADRLLHPQDGNRTWLHEQLGRLYLRLGRPDAARLQFQAAIRHWPDNTAARKAIDRLRR